MLKAYFAWVERARAAGTSLAEYLCPVCAETMNCPMPPENEEYTSMVSCPFCGNLHFKVVKADGSVTTKVAA